MKASLCLAVAAGFFLAGCGDKSNSSASATNTATAGSSPLNAPANYLGAITRGEQNAVKTVDVTSVNQAIQLFNVDHGRNPKDLDELVTEKYLPLVPTPPYGTRLDYDPAGGRVSVVKQ